MVGIDRVTRTVARVIHRIYLQGVQQSSNLDEIRTFVALADAGSFVAAGRLLDRDPTVLSRRMQALEERIGVRLAERSTRVVTLTEAGAQYLARMRVLLHELDMADREAAAFHEGEPHGHLRVALPGSFARLWLGPLITGFLEAHPRVTLEACYSNAFVDLVAQRFDLAVRLAEMPDSRLVARKVATRRRLICASPDYLARTAVPTHPDDVASHECLCFTGRHDPYRWRFRSPEGDGRTVSVRCRIASDDADLLVEAAVAGLGLLYTTDWHVGPLLAQGALVELLADWPVADEGAIFVVTHASSGLATQIRAFSDWIARGLTSPPWHASGLGM